MSKSFMDRKARHRLIAAIERFLAEKTTAFEFDDEIFAIRDATDDSTVKELVLDLWLFYDDLTDHHVRLSREGWGFMQRVLLLLSSDYELQITHARTWLPTQPAAASALVAIVAAAAYLGYSAWLWALLLLSGMMAMLILCWRTRLMDSNEPYAPILLPFGTFAELAQVRRATKFQKQRYPNELAARASYPAVINGPARMLSLIAACFLSPLFLFYCLFPASRQSTAVVRGPS